MKAKRFLDIIGGIDEKFIEEAENAVKPAKVFTVSFAKRYRSWWFAPVGVCLVLAVSLALPFIGDDGPADYEFVPSPTGTPGVTDVPGKIYPDDAYGYYFDIATGEYIFITRAPDGSINGTANKPDESGTVGSGESESNLRNGNESDTPAGEHPSDQNTNGGYFIPADDASGDRNAAKTDGGPDGTENRGDRTGSENNVNPNIPPSNGGERQDENERLPEATPETGIGGNNGDSPGSLSDGGAVNNGDADKPGGESESDPIKTPEPLAPKPAFETDAPPEATPGAYVGTEDDSVSTPTPNPADETYGEEGKKKSPGYVDDTSDFDASVIFSTVDLAVRYVDSFDYTPSDGVLAYLTEHEIFFNHDTDIFKGIVKEIRNIEINIDGEITYMAIATIEVNDVLRGYAVSGSTVSVLLPAPVGDGIASSENNDIVSQMRVGMEGIFMPAEYDFDCYVESPADPETKMLWRDIAEYGLIDGRHWVFLDGTYGLVFDSITFENLFGAVTLNDIKNYIDLMLQQE